MQPGRFRLRLSPVFGGFAGRRGGLDIRNAAGFVRGTSWLGLGRARDWLILCVARKLGGVQRVSNCGGSLRGSYCIIFLLLARLSRKPVISWETGADCAWGGDLR